MGFQITAPLLRMGRRFERDRQGHPLMAILCYALALSCGSNHLATAAPLAPELIDAEASGAFAHDVKLAVAPNGSAVAVWRRASLDTVAVWATHRSPGGRWASAVRLGIVGLNNVSPLVGIDADGNALAVWRDSTRADPRIWVCRFEVASGWRKPELLLGNDGTPVSVFYPQLAVAANGTALVLWPESRAQWGRTFVPGRGWETAQIVAEGAARDVQVAAAGNMGFFVVWEGEEGISARQMGPEGTWGQVRVLSGDGFNPAIGAGIGGHAIGVWQTGWYSFGFERYLPGEGWTGAQTVSGEEIRTVPVLPEAVVDEFGGVVVAWHGVPYGAHGPSRIETPIWATRFDPGLGWENMLRMHTDAWGPYLAGNSRGDAIVVWLIEDASSTIDIWGRQWADGWGWQPAQRIFDSRGGESDPASASVAMSAEGDAHIVWANHGGEVWSRTLPIQPQRRQPGGGGGSR